MWMRFLVIFGIAVLGFGTIRGENTFGSYFKLKESRKILEETVTSLRNENKNLSDEINKIKSSPAYAKKVLREKYHVTEDNEKIIFFAD